MSTDAVAGAATLYAYGAAALLKQLLLRHPPPAIDATCGIEGGAATSERCVPLTAALVIPLPHSHHVQMLAASNRTRYTRLRQVCFLSLVCFSCASFLCVLTSQNQAIACMCAINAHAHPSISRTGSGESLLSPVLHLALDERQVCVCARARVCVCVWLSVQDFHPLQLAHRTCIHTRLQRAWTHTLSHACTADLLAAHGCRVLVGCRDVSDGKRVAAELCRAYGAGAAVPAPLDLATSNGADGFARWAESELACCSPSLALHVVRLCRRLK
jgi:hypothetical protein